MRTLLIFVLAVLLQFPAPAQNLSMASLYSASNSDIKMKLAAPPPWRQDRVHGAKLMAIGGGGMLGGFLLYRNSIKQPYPSKGAAWGGGFGVVAMFGGAILFSIGTVELIANLGGGKRTTFFIDASSATCGFAYTF